jgi:diaminopimelate epimerase
MATPLVEHYGTGVNESSGRPFFKMTGSGNDFVIFDARTEPVGELERPDRIQALSARGTGIGADGVVFIQPSSRADYLMRYFNSDGSKAAMCGNAALCCARLAVELGLVDAAGFAFESDAGVIQARIRDGEPEIDMDAIEVVRPEMPIGRREGERRLGFAVVGNPHLVVACDSVANLDVDNRGRTLRFDPGQPEGANVNFLSREPEGWAIRTYERGVEGETLACGTGAVASAILLTAWGEAKGGVVLRTRSGCRLTVTVRRDGNQWIGSLRGEGRLVFRGALAEI